MKVTFTIFIVALALINLKAQAPDWAWVKSEGNSGDNRSTSTASDLYGNVYITGYFREPVISFGTSTLINTDSTWTTSDIFIVKYDALGNVLWAKREGGFGEDVGISVTTDAFGNVYVVGNYTSDTLIIGPTMLINKDSTGLSNDISVVKYDSLGNLLWVKDAGNTNNDASQSCKTDGDGNLYITGYYFSDSITFGTTVLTKVISQYFQADIFIVKYDSFGNVVWAKSHGSVRHDESNSLATDAVGCVYITGFFYDTINFGAITLNSAGPPNFADIFIVKYDYSGNLIWAIRHGGTNGDFGMSITCDTSGYIYLSGVYQSDTISFGSTTLTSTGANEAFIVKFNSLGNVIWANGINGQDWEYGFSQTHDAYGNVFVTGAFNSPVINFGTFTIINSGGSSQMFIAKYDVTGNLIWAEALGDNWPSAAYSITSNALGNIHITGRYNNSITFGTTTLTNQGTNMFIAKLDASIVDLEKNITDNEISIYPNPTKGIFTISNTNSSIKSCIIYNILGEYVFSQKSDLTNQINIDLSAQAKGIYFVETTDENWNVSNTKIIIQ
jgi:hypothetical protein